MKKLLLVLLLGSVLPLMSAAGTSSSGSVSGEKTITVPAELTKIFSSLKLKDGRTLKNVQLLTYEADRVGLKCATGDLVVDYELFPNELQAALAQVRPTAPPVRVTGIKGTVFVSPATPIDLKAPVTAPKIIYAGRITLSNGTPAGIPLQTVLVSAMSPAAYAIYNRDRLQASKTEIDQAYDKWMASAKGPNAARAAASADYMLTLYTSFTPPTNTLATAWTEENGSFTLTTDAPEVVLIARTSYTVGKDFIYLVWVMGARPGGPTYLDEKNLFIQTH